MLTTKALIYRNKTMRKWLPKDEYVKTRYPENYEAYLRNKKLKTPNKNYEQRVSYWEFPEESPFGEPH